MVLMTQNAGDVISDINSKIRSMESKNSLLSEHLLTVNQNSIEEYKRLGKEISILNSELKKLKEELFNVKQALNGFLRETDFFAKKNDIKVLEKYINLWNPLEFVTENDVERIIERKLLRKASSKDSLGKAKTKEKSFKKNETILKDDSIKEEGDESDKQ